MVDKSVAKRNGLVEWFNAFDVTNRWRYLLRQKENISVDDALEILTNLDVLGTNSNMVSAFSLVDVDMYVSDVYLLLKKVRRPIPNAQKHAFFSIYSKVKLIYTGRRGAAFRYYELSLSHISDVGMLDFNAQYHHAHLLYLEIDEFNKTEQLLIEYAKECVEHPSFIIYYSVARVNAWRDDKKLELNRYVPRELNVWRFGEEINALFKGIVCQHFECYPNAIWKYRRCNYLAAHPIHDWKLSQCYTSLRLYHKAQRYLDRAHREAKGQVPNIEKGYLEMKSKLKLELQSLECDVCGCKDGVDVALSPCSGCFDRYYCSKRCQKIGWKRRGHRSECSGDFKTFNKDMLDYGCSPTCCDAQDYQRRRL